MCYISEYSVFQQIISLLLRFHLWTSFWTILYFTITRHRCGFVNFNDNGVPDILHYDYDLFCNWHTVWAMKFNFNKDKLIHFCTNLLILQYCILRSRCLMLSCCLIDVYKHRLLFIKNQWWQEHSHSNQTIKFVKECCWKKEMKCFVTYLYTTQYLGLYLWYFLNHQLAFCIHKVPRNI